MNMELFKEADRTARFLVEHYEPASNWDDPIGYCAWYLSNGFMALIRDEEDEIVAVACARPVMEPGDGAVHYRFDPEGDCIFFDLLVIRDVPLAIPAFSEMLKQRFGTRQRVAYFRRHEEQIRVYSFDRFIKCLDRKGKRIELESQLALGET